MSEKLKQPPITKWSDGVWRPGFEPQSKDYGSGMSLVRPSKDYGSGMSYGMSMETPVGIVDKMNPEDVAAMEAAAELELDHRRQVLEKLRKQKEYMAAEEERMFPSILPNGQPSGRPQMMESKENRKFEEQYRNELIADLLRGQYRR